MSDRDDLFKETPSAKHANQVFKAVQPDLAENRKQSPSAWRGRLALVFSLALAGLLVIFRQRGKWAELSGSGPGDDALGALALMDAIENADEIEMLNDLELVEQLEELEQWENS